MSHGTVLSTGLIAVSAAVAPNTTNRGILHGVMIIPAAAVTTVTIHDNASAATGNVLFQASVPADSSVFFDLPRIRHLNGMFVSVTGVGGNAIIYHGA